MVGFCGFCTIEGNVNGKFEEKSEKLKFFIQNSYWEQNSLFAIVPLLAHIAQLVEHLASYHEVMSSSPRRSKKTFYARLCTIITHCAPECNLGSKLSSSGWSLVKKKDDNLAVQHEDVHGAAKGQLISKWFLGSSISSKKQTNEFVFTNMRIVFVRFLEEIDDLKKTFWN